MNAGCLQSQRSHTSMAAVPQQRVHMLSSSRVQRGRCLHVTCMAHPRRVAKVASQIQREVSEMMIYDKVVQEAICPERRRGLDDQLSAVASITEVYVSGDLQVAKVYVSIYSDEEGKERAISNLKRVAPYVRSRIGQAMGLRLTPEIRFIQDNSLDELEQLQDAIGREEFARIAAEAEAEAAGAGATASSAAAAAASTSSSSSRAAAGGASAEAAAGFGQEDLEDDAGGFFDMQDTAAGADAGGEGSAQGGAAAARPAVEWSRHDPNTFFAVDEDEVEEADAAWFSRRGPFDDLFGEAGEQLVQQRQQKGKQPRSGGGSKRGGKQGNKPAASQQ